MKESVAIAKEADTMSSPTRSDNSIHRAQNEPERQLGSLRGVIGNIRRNGGTPSVDSIATELSSMPYAQRASALLALQRTHGNQYVQRVVSGIQAKLVVGQPGDKYEQEADRVADVVMRMPESGVQRRAEEEKKLPTKTITPIQALTIQRQDDEEEEELKKKKKEEEEEEEELIMEKGISGKVPEVSDNLQARLNQSKGGGQPLSSETLSFMEERFGVDFSPVRIHTDSEASQMARALNAEAFTHGRDIYFGAGRYSPNTSSGKRLIAHEFTHIVQQNKPVGLPKLQRKEKEEDETLMDPEFELMLILGPIPKEQSVAYKQEKLLELYKYLKEVRNSAPELKQLVKNLLEAYFPGYGKEIWEESKKPFAGYVGTSKGIEAGKRLKEGEKLGLVKSGAKTWKKKFLGSDVIFFSGHHFARYGGPGEFEGLDVSKISFVSPRVRLIMISSCAGLRSNALNLWAKRFPNAYILGWRFASPLGQKGMMRKFLEKLPDDLILEKESDIKKILGAWKIYIEDLSKDPKGVQPYGLGYATPDGTVTYYVKIKGKWKWIKK
jgi:hypothetical protein